MTSCGFIRTPPLETVPATIAFCRVVMRTLFCPIALMASPASSPISPTPDGAAGMPRSEGALPSTPNAAAVLAKSPWPTFWLSSTKGTLHESSNACCSVVDPPPQDSPS